LCILPLYPLRYSVDVDRVAFPTRRSSDLTLAALPESLRPLPNLATLSMRKARFEVPWRCPPLVRSACHCNVHNLLRVHVDHEDRSEEHTSELQSRENIVCRLLLEKRKERD